MYFFLAQVVWINPAGGNWDVAGNWSTDALPTSADDVIIEAARSSHDQSFGE